MRAAVLLVLATVPLTACKTVAERQDEQCRSYGVKPGSDQYVQCRMNLDRNRAMVEAAEASRPPTPVFQPAPVEAWPVPKMQPIGQNRVTCTSRPGLGTVETNCSN